VVVGLEGAAPVLEGDAGGDLVGEARPAAGRVPEGLGRGGRERGAPGLPREALDVDVSIATSR
jgi:hypothetical protein